MYEFEGLWYFWDETWVDSYGPYDTEEIAREKLQEFCDKVLNYEGDERK